MPDDLGRACEQVGRFQYHFADVEDAINDGLAKTLELNAVARDIVCANVDMFKKLNILDMVVRKQFYGDDKEKYLELLSQVKGLNSPDRQTVIHSTFEPKGDGVSFTRIVARDGKLQRDPIVWNAARFTSSYENMKQLAPALRELVNNLRPIPMLDFSDPRNSGYIALLT